MQVTRLLHPLSVLLVLCLLATGCPDEDENPPDTGTDAGTDGGSGSEPDAGTDAGTGPRACSEPVCERYTPVDGGTLSVSCGGMVCGCSASCVQLSTGQRLDLEVFPSSTFPNRSAQQSCGPAEAAWTGDRTHRLYTFTEPGIYWMSDCGLEVQIVP